MGRDSNYKAAIQELGFYANELLLSSSKQAGFLSAALIAATPFWSGDHQGNIILAIAFLCLLGSILSSIIVHFITGLVYAKKANELIYNYKPHESFYIKPAIVFGVLQSVTLIVGVVLVTYLFFF